KLEQHGLFFLKVGLVRLAAVQHIVELPKDPRILHCTAADQNTVDSRLPPTSHSILDRCDVAVARYWNTDSVFYSLDQVPIRHPLVALLAGAAVDLNMLDAALLGHLCHVDDVDRRVRVAGPQLERERDGDRLLDLFQYLFQNRRFTKQSRTAAVLDHLWSRASAVDVENVGTNLLGHLGSHSHTLRPPTKDLYCIRPLFLIETHLPL